MNLWNDHLGDQIQIYILVKEKKTKMFQIFRYK